jgi:hypothetical protein
VRNDPRIFRRRRDTAIEYRAFMVASDGHIASFRAFTFEKDADAIAWAKQFVDGQDVELWSGTRFVIKLHKQSNPPQ